MRKFFAVALGTMVALVGFAGSAGASATVDLIWIDVTGTNAMGNVLCLRDTSMGAIIPRDCPLDPRSTNLGHTIGDPTAVNTSSDITLAVVLTSGPAGTLGGGVSVDYSGATPKVSVLTFQQLSTSITLPTSLGTTTDTGTFIDNVNAAAVTFTNTGIGLASGQSAYLGTITFRKDVLINGTSDFIVGFNGPGGTDGIVDGVGNDITAAVTLVSAELINVPEPGALSLLAMGLGGMLLAGRGRRS